MAKSRDEKKERLKRKRVKKLQESHGLLAEGEHALHKKRKREEHSEGAQELRSHISRKMRKNNLSSKTLQNEQDLHSASSSQGPNLDLQNTEQGQQLHDAVLYGNSEYTALLDDNVPHANKECPKNSMSDGIKKKKVKRKRDKWGQVLSNVGNVQDDLMEDDMVEKAEPATNEPANEDSDANHGISEGEYDNKTVCAGGMPYDTTEADIRELFKECGAIANVICMKFADTQRFKGLAFVTFKTEAAATKALSLDGVNMGGRHIKIEKARAGGKVLRAPPKREPGSLSVYIGNLNWDTQRVDIKRFFKGCAIDDVRLAVDNHTGDFRGYGHVDFSDEKSLENAIELDQKQLRGRPIKVSYAVSQGSKRNVSS